MQFLKDAFYFLFNILWGDLITIPLPGGDVLGISLLVLLLILCVLHILSGNDSCPPTDV